MRFTVPQFVDVEDKLFGQFTLKQAVYMVGSIGIAIVFFIQYGFFVAVLVGAPLILLAFLLSFVKIHGRPFVHILSSAVFYALKSKLYLWKKDSHKKKAPSKPQPLASKPTRPVSVEVSQSKLKKLAWTLDTTNQFDKQ